MLRDIHLALRTLRRAPAFTLTTIAVLALGIGANTAIFGLVNQALLRPDGIVDPERVVAVRARYDKLNLLSIPVSVPDYQDVARGSQVFDCAAIMSGADFNYSSGDSPERLQGARVSQRWFDVFGARPLLGRTFRPEEDQPNANMVVVLAHAAWQRVFGADPGIVGRTILLNQKPYKVVGVMRDDFRWPRRVDAWAPLGLPAAAYSEENRFNESYTAVARMRPGVAFAQAEAFVRLAADRVRSRSDENGGYARDSRWTMFALPMTDFAARDTRTPLMVLMGAVGFVLLIACSNVAGLMVARAAARGREIAVRSALGASRLRLLRETMAESVVVAAGGALFGLVIAVAGTKLLLLTAPEEAIVGLGARVDLPVLLFTLVAAAVSALLSAAAPAWQAWRIAPFDQIKAGGRSATSGRGRQRFRAALVVGETALALVLLVAAGLLLRSFARLNEVSPGFDARGVMTARLSLPASQYDGDEKRAAFFRALLDRLSSAPGVSIAGVGLPMPFSGDGASASFSIEGRVPGPGDPGPHGDIRYVTPGYFGALGIPVRAGRLFTDQDRAGSARVVVVDDNLAREYWPNESAIGKRMRNGSTAPWATIVGIVGHVKHSDLAHDSGKGAYYYPLFQQAVPYGSIVVKTAGPLSGAAAAIRQAIHDVDPAQPVHHMVSMDDLVGASLAPRRFAMRLLAFFAAVALMMAALGLYGVISYSVSQRTPEIGIRLALGAQPREVAWLVLRSGFGLAAAGMALGGVGSLAAGRLLGSQLYGVAALDPATYAATIAILLGAAFLACRIPARRATRVDPLIALRTE